MTMVLKDDSTTFSQRIKKQKALKKFEEKVKLMETNCDEFCLLVNLIKIPCSHDQKYFAPNPILSIKIIYANAENSICFVAKEFSFQLPGALHQCELAAREAGNREKEVMYKNMIRR